MKPFIEDQNNNRYEFKNLTRKQQILVFPKLQKIKAVEEQNSTIDTNSMVSIDDLFTTIFKFNYPNFQDKEIETLLDYNSEVYGMEDLYEIMGDMIFDSFTQVGGENHRVHPYLLEKRAKEQQENTEETTQQETESPYQTY